MKGFKFGKKNSYTILKKLNSGWEGTVYTAYSSRKQLVVAKMIPIGDAIKICPSWGHEDFDLRRNNPFKTSQCIDWHSYAEEQEYLQNEVLSALKLLKQQHSIHMQLQRKKIPCMIPPLLDWGLVLLPSSQDFIPTIYEIYPLVQGKTVKSLLDSIEAEHLAQSIINTSRVRAGLDIEASYKRLARMFERTLIKGLYVLKKAGYSIAEYDLDLHPSNLIYGRIGHGENQIYLIDHRLTSKYFGCSKDELIYEVQQLGDNIRNWNRHGVLFNAYYDGLIDELPQSKSL